MKADALQVKLANIAGKRRAVCEGFFGRLKTELFHPRNWQDVSIERFIGTVDAYIHWHNEKRIKISLGSLSPIEYRASLGFTA